MLRALFALSEGGHPSAALTDEAHNSRDAFLRHSCVKFVLVNKRRASNELRAFAVDALGLTLVHEDAEYVLLTPASRPECDQTPRSARR
jgi:hypothetical protein